jgi:purine-binding chemotaxis protein CheW
MSDTAQTADAVKLLTFIMGKDLFALDIATVREILDFTEITKIPQTPDYMRGVVNLRGNAVPVIDLRYKYGMGETERTILTRIVILEVPVDGEMTVTGIMADAVKEVIELDRDQIKAPPKMGTAVDVTLIKGIADHGGKFIIILEADKIFFFSGPVFGPEAVVREDAPRLEQ